ncbi:MAG: adenosine deaminase [Nannocystaceae bacterium]|nr:adenosine deaminase [bacterium]
MTSFAARMPKVELHLHIEGTLEPELMFELAARNGVTLPYASVEALRAAYDFGNLQDFLDLYYQGAAVLLKEQDFFDLAWAYFSRVHQDNVEHAELFFDPQTHTERGVAMGTVIEGLAAACTKAHEELGISSALILCFLRHLDGAAAVKTLTDAMPFREHFIGVGLDSAEVGNPPEGFRDAFELAGAEGLHRVAHAGEEGPPAYIWGALDALHVERVDHGVRCLEDEALVARLSRERIPLTVCPLSNVKLRVFDTLADHNLTALLEAGLCATVNSDDPAYFGGYMNDNFVQCQQALGLSDAQLRLLADNAIAASFASEARKAELRASLASVR